MKATIKNKLGAIFMILVGLVPCWLDNDATALVLFSMIAIPMFFSKKAWFY